MSGAEFYPDSRRVAGAARWQPGGRENEEHVAGKGKVAFVKR